MAGVKELSGAALRYEFWADWLGAPPAAATDADAADAAAEGAAVRDGATAEESELWRALLSDAKFEATLRRTAPTILAKLLSAKALAEVLVNEKPAEEAEEAAAAAEEEATLRLPSEVERVLGQGAHGSGKGTLPAAWWGAAHDRALLTHSDY